MSHEKKGGGRDARHSWIRDEELTEEADDKEPTKKCHGRYIVRGKRQRGEGKVGSMSGEESDGKQKVKTPFFLGLKKIALKNGMWIIETKSMKGGEKFFEEGASYLERPPGGRKPV